MLQDLSDYLTLPSWFPFSDNTRNVRVKSWPIHSQPKNKQLLVYYKSSNGYRKNYVSILRFERMCIVAA